MATLDLLKGMKVIDMASFVAAPICAKILADYGADVIRVEELKGDDKCREVGMRGLNMDNGDTTFHDVLNGNKRNLAVNTRTPEGLAILKKLLETADVFVTHLREKDRKKLGLDWDTLHAINPGLIVGNVTGYGTEGPYAARGGLDSCAYVTRAGVNHGAMPVDSRPYSPYPGQGDIPTGTYLAMGIIAAYVKKLRTGIGDNVYAHLYGAGIWSGVTPIISAQEPYNKQWPEEPTACISALNYSYMTKDKKWVTLFCNGWTKPWTAFVKAAGLDESLIEKYPDWQVAYVKKDEMIELVGAWVAEHDYAEIDELFDKIDIPHDVCLSFREIVDDPVALEAGFLQEICNPVSGCTVKIPRSPVTFQLAGRPDTEISVFPGHDSMEIMKEYGYSDEEIKDLAEKKIIGLGDTYSNAYLITRPMKDGKLIEK